MILLAPLPELLAAKGRPMPRSLLRLAFLLGFGLLASAATAADEDAIKAAVQRYFDACEKRDLAALEKALSPKFSTPQAKDRDAFLARMKVYFPKLKSARYKVTIKWITAGA